MVAFFVAAPKAIRYQCGAGWDHVSRRTKRVAVEYIDLRPETLNPFMRFEHSTYDVLGSDRLRVSSRQTLTFSSISDICIKSLQHCRYINPFHDLKKIRGRGRADALRAHMIAFVATNCELDRLHSRSAPQMIHLSESK